MNRIFGSSGVQIIKTSGTNQKFPETKIMEITLQQAFQDFFAGTFYKQMFQSLRKMHSKPAYFHGGRAEEVFQSQMDQEVAENLARDQGSSFSDPMFSVFARKFQYHQQQISAETKEKSSPTFQSRAS